MSTNNNDNNLEPPAARPSYLPSQDEVAAAKPDQRAILYAEALVAAKRLGETVDPGWVRGACGVLSDLDAKYAPRLLAEVPAYAAEVKAGRAEKLPTAGNAWHFLLKREAKKAAAVAPSAETEPAEPMAPIEDSKATPNSTNSEKTSPIGEVSANSEGEVAILEKVSEPEPAEADRPRFEELKRIVHGGLATFLEVGCALAEIRSRKLYRLAGFTVFDDFLRAEFNLSRAYGYRLMGAVATVEDLASVPGVPPPTNSEQVRSLAGLTSEEKKEVWTEASATAPEGKPPTGAAVKKVREARGKGKPKAAAKPKVTPSNTDKPSVGGESATSTVPGQNAGPVSLETHVDLAADELARVLAGWKRGSLAPLQKAALGNERLGGALKRVEKDLDALVERLRSYRTIAS